MHAWESFCLLYWYCIKIKVGTNADIEDEDPRMMTVSDTAFLIQQVMARN